MGQWPAAALIYRRGYIRQGEPVVREQRSLDDIWHRRMPIIAEDPGYDPNRDQANISRESNIKEGVNPLAYLVGPVLVKYGGAPSQSRVVDLQPFIHADTKTVQSVTDELELNYGKGLCTLNAPKAQGVTGFLKKAGDFKLADVEIQSGNDYATVLVVSMDDRPLKDSTKNPRAGRHYRTPAGWKTKPAQVSGRPGEEVVSFGHAPWMIVRGDVTISLANSKISRARVLDPNGMLLKDIPLANDAGRKRFQFPGDALYVVLQ